MTKNLKKITTVGVGVILAIILACCSAIALTWGGKNAEKGTAYQQVAEDKGIAISSTDELWKWLEEQETNAYLTADITFTQTRSEWNLSKTLYGDGYKVIFTRGDGESIMNSNILGVFCRVLSGTIKDVNFVYSETFTQSLSQDGQKNNVVYMGLIAGQIEASGLLDNCSVTVEQQVFFNKKYPAYRSNDCYMLAGLLAGNLIGTVRDCTINLNQQVKFEAYGTGSVSSGSGDTGYLGAAIGRISNGKLLNTTLNIGENGSLAVDGQQGSTGDFAGGLVAQMLNGQNDSLVDGVIINNAERMANNVKARTGNEALIVALYESGTVKSIYADNDLSNISCDGTNTIRPGDEHSNHANIALAGGSKAPSLDFNVNNFGGGGLLEFKLGDLENVYYTNTALSEEQCLWAVKNSESGASDASVNVWKDYDIASKSVKFAKRNAAAINNISFEKGTIIRGANFGFVDTADLMYGAKELPNVQMIFDHIPITGEFDVVSSFTKNDNGYYNQGTYAITGITSALPNDRIGVESAKTFYIDHIVDEATKGLTINKKSITMELGAGSNIYNTNVTVKGLLSDETVAFDGLVFGADAVSIPRNLLVRAEGADKVILKFSLGQIPEDSNYKIDEAFEFEIADLVIGYDSVIEVPPTQDDIVSGKIVIDKKNYTITITDNTVTGFDAEAIAGVYGMKYTGFSGAETENLVTSNGKITARILISGTEKAIGLNSVIDTMAISVSATAGGTATVVKLDGTTGPNKDVTLGEKFTLKANIADTNKTIFLGWTNGAGEYVSCDLEVSFYAREAMDYKANFGVKESGKIKVRINNLFGEGVVEFYAAEATEDAILQQAMEYLDDFNHEAYNECTGFEIESKETQYYVLKPKYADSAAPVSVNINGASKRLVRNEEITLDAGTYIINDVKVVFDKETVIYAMNGLRIKQVASAPDNTKPSSIKGDYVKGEINDPKGGYLNLTITSEMKLSGELVLTLNENGMAKYRAVIKYTYISENIIQAIVSLPLEVFAQLKGEKTVTASVNGVEIGGNIILPDITLHQGNEEGGNL